VYCVVCIRPQIVSFFDLFTLIRTSDVYDDIIIFSDSYPSNFKGFSYGGPSSSVNLLDGRTVPRVSGLGFIGEDFNNLIPLMLLLDKRLYCGNYEFVLRKQFEGVPDLFGYHLSIDKLSDIISAGKQTTSDIDFPERIDDVVVMHYRNVRSLAHAYDDYVLARFQANPYELVGKLHYVNRSALKLRELIDAYPLLFEKGMVALDVCVAPGGWVQVLNEQYGVSPFVISIVDSHANKMRPIEDIGGYVDLSSGIGDILNEDFLRSVDWPVVDLLLHDGSPFSLEDEPVKEEDHFRYLMSNLLIMKCSLKKGGNYVTKIFDIIENGTLCFVSLLTRSFEFVDICKLKTSRQASSEKYLVCRGFKSSTLFESVVNNNLMQLRCYGSFIPRQMCIGVHQIVGASTFALLKQIYALGVVLDCLEQEGYKPYDHTAFAEAFISRL